MAAMTNPDIGAKMEHVNQRINRIMEVVTGMESKLEGLSSSLTQLNGGTPVTGTQVAPGPRQLPTLSGASENPMMRDLGAMLPLVQSLMQGTQPDAQTLLHGLSALLNLKQQGSTQAQAPVRRSAGTGQLGGGSGNGNGFIIFLVLILLLLGSGTTRF